MRGHKGEGTVVRYQSARHVAAAHPRILAHPAQETFGDWPATSEEINVDPSLLVDQPVPCAQCGFDLRGTPIGAVCPECGLRVLATRGGVRVDGKYVVVRSGIILPERCVKTNEPVATAPITKTLYWMHPGWFFTVLLGVIVLLIVYLLARKSCRITYFISPAVKGRTLRRQLGATGIVLLGIVAVIVGVTQDQWVVALIGVFAFLVGLILVAVFSNVLAIRKAKDGEFWLKGCGPEFVESIRALTSAPGAQP
ncbi:MAG: hypothetical protein U0575_09730 [Phycisphaerales bacterium]